MPLYDSRNRLLEPAQVNSKLAETVEWQAGNLEILMERLAELELSMEDQGWRQLMVNGQREFSRAGLGEIVRMSRLMYLKNPLIKRGVEIQALYVWGRGVTIAGRDPKVNEVVQDFLDDPKNQAELTSHAARKSKEIDLQVMGNIFFVFFTNPSSGEVTTRSIPMEEVRQIVANPDDAKEPWFYRREWNQVTFNAANGAEESTAQVVYYPDWRYNPKSKPAQMYGKPVRWDEPVAHLKVGGLGDMMMGVPETYAALDWGKAWKEALEDYCSILRAHARYAWDFMTTGGQRGVDAAKKKFATTLASGANETTIETNPAPTVGATLIRTENTKVTPMKTAGATTSPEEGRRVFLMGVMAMGWPETFFGDASVGTVATAKSLDRPTELKVKDRQTLWAETILGILDFVIDRSAGAPSGKLAGKTLVKQRTAADGAVIPLTSDPKAGEAVDRHVDISFPNVLEHDIKEQVDAMVKAATLGNTQGQLVGTMDLKTLSKMLLRELGVDQIDEILQTLFPEGEEIPTGKERQLPADPNAPPANPDHADGSPQPSVDDDLARSATATESTQMTGAVIELRKALVQFREKYKAA